MSDWVNNSTIEESCEVLDSQRKPIKKDDRKSGDYPYYGASGIADFIDDYVFEGTHLLLSEDGDNLKTRKTPVAFLAHGKFWVNNHAHVLKGKNGNLTEYICYALQIADITSFISGSTRPKITQSDMRKIRINLPPLPEQKAIAHVLGKLDEKIELNRKMNQTLESMAQALFKSWFVDFDPVIDNALAANNPIPVPLKAKAEKRQSILKRHTALNAESVAEKNNYNKLFPSAFEYNETLNKWIPEGWLVNSLGEHINVKHGYAFKGEFFTEEPTNDILLTPGNFKIGGGFKAGKFKYYLGEYPEDYVLKKGDLIITMTDLSKEGDTLGYPALIPEHEEINYLHNQRLGKVELLNTSLTEHFLYHILCGKRYRHEIVGGASGTTVKHTAPKKIMAHEFILPSQQLINVFTRIAKGYIDRTEKNELENKKLTQLRDTLLPKLISGKVRLPNGLVEKFKE